MQVPDAAGSLLRTGRDMARRRVNLVAVAVGGGVIVACLVGAAYVKKVTDARDRAPTGPGGVQPMAVSVAQIQPRSVSVDFNVRGFLRAFEAVTVHAEVDGRVVARHVDEGRAVRKGQSLLELDTTFRRLTVKQLTAQVQSACEQQRQAKAGLDTARAQVAEAEAAQQNAINEFQRIERLAKQGHAVPVEVDRIATRKRQCEARMRMANAALAAAVSKMDAADADLSLAKAHLEEADERLKRCAIASPIDGIVAMVGVEAGEYVRPAQPVCEVIRVDKFKLVVELSGQEAVLIRPKTKATVYADAMPDDAYEATVVRIGPRANPTSRKFPVELHVANRRDRLMAGMFCRCVLPAGRRDNVLMLPREAVVERYGAEYCYLAQRTGEHAMTARLARIETRNLPGRSGEVQIVAGLKPGVQVVTTAAEQLRDGQPIRPRDPEGLAVGVKQTPLDATP